jgi:hypothetical protein
MIGMLEPIQIENIPIVDVPMFWRKLTERD